MTHGVTERNSGLFYWGQSGAINESISDIIGEIIDHRHPSAGRRPPTNWALGEDIPGFPNGLRNMQDPTAFERPGQDVEPALRPGRRRPATYPDNDGVHTNCGRRQQDVLPDLPGRDLQRPDDHRHRRRRPGLTKSAQAVAARRPVADLRQRLRRPGGRARPELPGAARRGTAGFTAADCANVHKATLATELRSTPTNNPQPADADGDLPDRDGKRVLFDSETGDADVEVRGRPDLGARRRRPGGARSPTPAPTPGARTSPTHGGLELAGR